MADIRIERDFNVSPERLFQAITQQADILNWWGYDGTTHPSFALNFSQIGPWHSEMIMADGGQFKLSGQVTHVRPPQSVGFTWAWHDGDDNRGDESHVTFTVEKTDTGSRLIIDHRDLASDEIAARHMGGWTGGPIPRLERFVATLTT